MSLIISLPLDKFGSLEMTGETPDSEVIVDNENNLTLFEDARYSYRLNLAEGVSARWKNATLIKPSKLDFRFGSVDTLNESGVFRPLLVLQKGSIQKQISFCWKVRPRKLTQDQLNWMLRDLASFAVESLVDLRSDISTPARFIHSDTTQSMVAFSLLRRWFLKGDMQECFSQILHRPYCDNRDSQTQLRPFGFGGHRWLGSPTTWRELPASHVLSSVVKLLPEQVPVTVANPTYDVPENRIVVRILKELVQYLDIGEKYTPDDCDIILRELQHLLQSPILHSIEPAENLNNASLVLRQRAGYRELWNFWHRLQNTNLIFSGVPNGEIEKRSNEQLYESWLLACFIRGLSTLLGTPETEFSNPFQRGASFTWHTQEHQIQLTYNRTFSGKSLSGSWSTTLRPDFTVSYWSKKNPVRHVHFDAKYRQSESGEFLREDLHKMHTYRDAIHNSIGAYVLFPVKGNTISEPLLFQSGDKQTGVGAFPICPLENETECAIQPIIDFLKGLEILRES